MDFVFILVSIFLGATTYVAQSYLYQETAATTPHESILSESISNETIKEASPTSGSPTAKTADTNVTIKITPLPPTNPPPPTTNSLINDFRYPSSSETSSSGNSLTLKSNDSPDTITDWYKNKIKSSGMNTTSFVVTKTNNNVLNKLVGANGQTEVRVDIKRDAGSNETLISVSLN